MLGAYLGQMYPGGMVSEVTGGGTEFQETVNDNTGATDSQSISIGYSRTQSDSAGTVDSLATVSAKAADLTDSTGATDAVVTAVGYVRSQTDTSGPTDALTGALTAARSQSDVTGATDSLTAAMAVSRTQDDTTGLTDSASFQLGKLVQFDDSTGMVDSSTTALSIVRTLTDGTGTADTAATTSSFVRVVDDSAGSADSLVGAEAYARSVGDDLGLSDAASHTLVVNTVSVLTFNFENGTDGVKVETTDTPSSGDTAFSAATENTSNGGTLKYDTTHAAHGTKGLKVATGATGISSYVQWDTSSNGLTKYHRVYVYLTANPAANWDLIQARDTAGRHRLRITSAGKVALVNGSSQIAASTTSVGLNQWVRLEFKVVVDASAGVLEAKLFNTPDDVTATETVTSTGLNTGTTETTSVRVGLPIGASNFGPVWLDDLAVDYTAYPGPASGSIVQSGSANDTFGLVDTVQSVLSSVGILTDSAGVTDTVTRVADYIRVFTDSAGVVDTQNTTNGQVGNPTDTFGMTDTVTIAKGYGRVITDAANVVDSVSSQDRATTGGGSGANFYDVPLAVYDTQPGDAVIYTGTTSLGTAMSGLAAGKWLILDYDGDRTENINIALQNNVTIVAAEGRRPWLNGNIRISAGESTRIYGLNVRNSAIGGSDHMVKLDGGSPDWGYSIITLEDNAAGDGAYTLMRPGQSVHDWRVHHCWIHDNPGATGHNGAQDHGFYCSAENATQNGQIDHCLIENMPEGRNIKIGGPSGGGPVIGDILIQYCTLKNGQGPSNGQVSNGAKNTTWEFLLLVDSGSSTNLTEGSGASTGNIYRNCKGDTVVGPNTTNFDDAGGNTNSVSDATLINYSAQGLLGFGHLEGFTTGGTGGTDYGEGLGDQARLTDALLVSLTGPTPVTIASAASSVSLSDEVSAFLRDTVLTASIEDNIGMADVTEDESGRLVYEFRPPVVQERLRLPGGHPLFSRMSISVGVSVLKNGSSYRQVRDPSPAEITAADAFYMGGHSYEIQRPERDALVAAGYGSFITAIE